MTTLGLKPSQELRAAQRARTSSPNPAMPAAKPFPTYLGSKDASGSAERIIASFPPHSLFVDAFVGNGAITRRKTPALHTIAIDKDPDVIDRWLAMRWPGVEPVCACAIRWLENNGHRLPADALVYADPTYMPETRTSSHRYRHELTEDDHRRLLKALDELPCSAAISGYFTKFYADRLRDWRHESWQAMTRGGTRTEHLWVRTTVSSFGAPQFVGNNFRERERVRRLVKRWQDRFVGMERAQRHAVLAALLAEERKLSAFFGDPAPSTPAMEASDPLADRSIIG